MADEEVAQESELEGKARETGWVPKEEWKGKPENWKPANDWLERSNPRYVPALEKKIGGLERKLAQQETEFADRLKRLETSTRAALKDERERIEREYEEKIVRATELGDTEGVKKALENQRKDMAKLSDKAEKAEEKQERKEANDTGVSPEVEKSLKAWLDENDWYNKSRVLARRFDAFIAEVEDESPGLTPLEGITEAKKRLVKAYPKQFGVEEEPEDEEEPRPSKVEGGKRNTNGAKTAWSKVPAEDRQICDSLIKGDGLFLSDEARKEWRKSKTVSDVEMGKARQKWLVSYEAQ